MLAPAKVRVKGPVTVGTLIWFRARMNPLVTVKTGFGDKGTRTLVTGVLLLVIVPQLVLTEIPATMKAFAAVWA